MQKNGPKIQRLRRNLQRMKIWNQWKYLQDFLLLSSVCQGVNIHVEDAMRNLPNHAKIQGIIISCTYSRVREGLLQMHEGAGPWAAARRACWSQRGPHFAVATQPAPPVRPCLPRSSLAASFQALLCRQHGTCGSASWTRAPRKTPSPPSAMLQLGARSFLWCVALFESKLSMLVQPAANERWHQI